MLRRARAPRVDPRRDPASGSTRCGAARCRSTSPGSTSSSSGTPSVSRSRPRSGRRSTARSSSTSPSARRRPTPATRTSRPSGRWSTSCPTIDRRIVVVMKSTVPVGTGEKVRHRLDARGLGHVGYVSNPEFTAEGTAVNDFLEPDRIVIGAFDEADARRRRGAARRDRRTDRPRRRRVGRDDQARRERRADDADLVHQRDRERLRGDGRRRRQGRGGHRPRPPDRQELPASGDRLRRELLPEGLARAQAARRELGLPLPGAERRDRGERAPEAPRDRQARRASRRRCAGKRIALLGLAFKPHTDDTREAPAFVLAGRLLAEGADVVAWDPVASADGLHGVEQVVDASRTQRASADAAVLVTEWPELADVDWAAVAGSMRTPVFVDGRNMLDPEAMRAAGFTYDGDRPCRVRPARPDGGDRPRRRQGRAARRRGGRASRSRSSPSAGRPLLAWQIGRLARSGVDRVIVSCARRAGGRASERQLDGARRRARLRRRAGAARARRRHPLRRRLRASDRATCSR